MEEIRRNVAVPRLNMLPKRKRTPLLTDAVAFAALGVGGWLTLELAGLVLRALGVG